MYTARNLNQIEVVVSVTLTTYNITLCSVPSIFQYKAIFFVCTNLWRFHTDVYIRKKRHWNSNVRNSKVNQSNLVQKVLQSLCHVRFSHSLSISLMANAAFEISSAEFSSRLLSYQPCNAGFNQMKWWKENTIMLYKYMRWNERNFFSYRKYSFLFVFVCFFLFMFIHSFVHSFIFFPSFFSWKRKESNGKKNFVFFFFSLLRIICHSL